MFAANTYRIRLATDDDSFILRRLAERNSRRPLTGRVLIGQIDDTRFAALSLRDGRAIADPSAHADYVLANLRMRAVALRAHETTPSLHDRIVAAMSRSTGTAEAAAWSSMTQDVHADHEARWASA